MDRFTRCALVAACLLSLSSPLLAASFIAVPSDRELVRHSDAIVVGQALASHTQLNPRGGIETVTAFSIEEVIKGDVVEAINVYEPGGTYGRRTVIIPGVPRFSEGERVLIFLRHTGVDRWSVTDLAVGRFSFETDRSGHLVAVRADDDFVGWDSDGKTHSEQRRSEQGFLNFLRAESRGGPARSDYFIPAEPLQSRIPASQKRASLLTTYTATSYTLDSTNCATFSSPGCGTGTGTRWSVFPGIAIALWTEPATAANAVTAVQTAVNTWSTATGASVNYTWAVDPCNSGCKTNGLLGAPDGANSVLFEQDLSSYGVPPISCSTSSWEGLLGIGGVSAQSVTHVGPNGETFETTTEGDVQMNKGMLGCVGVGPSFQQGDLVTDVTHEIGHTLGFRHSDQTRADDPAKPCSGTLECATLAVMKARIPSGLNGALQIFEQNAVRAVYPAAACTAPTITTQPAGTTIPSGQSATLSVVASGTAPLNYQWYIGNPPSTTSPTGTNSSSLTVSPTTTTTYWVLVSNSCGTVNSAAATVTVCTAPSITTQPASTTITSGQSAMLTVAASGSTPLTYQWYIGSPPSTTSPTGTNSSSLTVSPTTTTTYWVLVSNSCGSVNSAAATVTVSACPNPTISTAPNACMGSNANTATVTPATGATYAWSITNGTITGGAGKATITFSPTAAGSVTLQVTVATLSCSSTPSATVIARTCAGSGDANGDGSVSVSDVFYLINSLFAGGPAPAGGTGDANGSGAVEVSDVFYMINYLFAGGPAPK